MIFQKTHLQVRSAMHRTSVLRSLHPRHLTTRRPTAHERSTCIETHNVNVASYLVLHRNHVLALLGLGSERSNSQSFHWACSHLWLMHEARTCIKCREVNINFDRTLCSFISSSRLLWSLRGDIYEIGAGHPSPTRRKSHFQAPRVARSNESYVRSSTVRR